ncbi:MAG: hypothetical protein ACTJLK_03780 [Anaplasma sp.]
MKPRISKYVQSFCCTAFVTIILSSSVHATSMDNRDESESSADLGFRLGVYQEVPGPKRQQSQKAELAKFAEPQKVAEAVVAALQSANAQPDKSYTALAGVRYLVTTQKLGNFSAELGYAYRSERLTYSFSDIKQKMKSYSSPYAEARWGTSRGLLLVRDLEFSVGTNIGGEKIENGSLPIRVMGGLRYRVAGIASIYAGMQYVTHFKATSPLESIKNDNAWSSRYVLGIEFSM